MAEEKDLFDPRLTAFLSRARIDCELFEYKCPLSWGKLQRMFRKDTRYCGECRREVYLVTNEKELVARTREGACIAVIRPEEIPHQDEVDHLFAIEDGDDDQEDVFPGGGFTMGIPAR